MKKNKVNKMNNKLRTNLEFKTAEEHKSSKNLSIVLLVGILVLGVAILSALLFIHESKDDPDSIFGRNDTTEESTDPADEIQSLEGALNILLVCSDDDNKKLHHCAVATVDLENTAVTLTTINVKKEIKISGYRGTLSSLFKANSGSMLKLESAVEEYKGITIDRYVHATDTTFKSMMKIIGNVSFNVPENVSYSCKGVGYKIDKGKQELTADMSYKYMFYLSQQEGNKPKIMSEFIAALITKVFSSSYYNSADSYYSKFSNALDTDISAIDYGNSYTDLGVFISAFEQNPDIAIAD